MAVLLNWAAVPGAVWAKAVQFNIPAVPGGVAVTGAQTRRLAAKA
jgi:hypothetical protein